MNAVAGRRRTLVLSLAVALAALAISSATASAVIVSYPGGKTYSYQPLAGHSARPFDAALGNLDYNGGPVMPSNTNILIFWSPSGLGAYPAEYPTGLQQYLQDLAHDSGGNQNVDSVATQYNDATGNVSAYKSSYGGSFTDTDPYPTSDCPVSAPATECLTGAQIQAELAKFIDANHLPRDLEHEYFLLTPPHIEDCFDNNPNDPNQPYGGCSAGNPTNAAFCAYHSSSLSQPLFIYSNDPYVTGNGGCDDGNHPNGASDGALEGGFSHEHNESITDPLPDSSWADASTGGQENGDLCSAGALGFAKAFGTPLGTENGHKYNQLINGHFYWYQQEFSNDPVASQHCLQRYTPSGTPPTASFSDTAGAVNTMSFDGSSSTGTIAHYNWQFNDGPGLNTATEKSTPTVSHTFPTVSPYAVGLTVLEAGGRSAGAGRLVTPGQSGTTPGFTTSANPASGHPATFTGLSQINGDSVFLWYWEFGDGTVGSGQAPAHTYAAPGTYKVTEVLYGVGGAAVTSQQVAVKPSPTASFTVTTPKPVAGQATNFDGSGSSEPGGSIASYSWNFGDGTAAGTGATTSHIYAAAGTYTVTLTATDATGISGTQTQQVAVAQAPKPSIRVNPSHPTKGNAVTFNGTHSSDPNGSIVTYSWSFGDSSAAQTGSKPKHTYHKTGHFTVTLTTTDSAGISASTTKTINVVKAAKIAKASLKRKGGTAFLAVKVTGAGSVKVGSKRIKLHRSGTAKFRLTPGHHTLKVKFTPVAGPVQHKKLTVNA
jgi:PKD repeat protein